MSWLSRAKNAFINLVAGKPADLEIVRHPTTPIERVINGLAPVVLTAAAKTPGAAAAANSVEAIEQTLKTAGAPKDGLDSLLATLERDAGQAAKTFITAEIGPVLGGLVDAGAEALAVAAIQEISSFKTRPALEIAEALGHFLEGLRGAGAPAAKPA